MEQASLISAGRRQRHPPDTPERCCDALGPGQITDDHLRAEPAQRDHAITVTTDHHAN